jgi:small subunit ribosomal protein S18
MKKKKVIRRVQKNIVPKKCFYCEEKKEPNFLETPLLKKFLSERGKIVPRSRNGLCAKHQRHLTVSIKHARHLALLPFLVR